MEKKNDTVSSLKSSQDRSETVQAVPTTQEEQGQEMGSSTGVSPDQGKSPLQREEITSTYRAMYGGPQGAPASVWRSKNYSRNETEVGVESELVAGMLEQHARITVGNESDERAASSSLQKAVKNISVLTTGQVLKHGEAMESLVDILKESTGSAEVMREIHTQGGTHVMYTNVHSSDKTLRNLSAEGLVCVCTHDKEALHEVVSSREICSSIIGTSVREVLTSQSSPHRELFDLLIHSKSPNAQKSCAEHKVVLKCVERLEARATKQKTIDVQALHMLYTMLATESRYYADSIVWNGGLGMLVTLLSLEEDIIHDQTTRDAAHNVARMLSIICQHEENAAELLCTAEAVKCLSCMIADPKYPLDVQLAVSRILLAISRVSKKKAEVVLQLQDYCLPRVCEIVHQSKDTEMPEDSSMEYELWTTCAGIVSYLSQDSDVCCHVIIFHADILQQSIRLLTKSLKYEQARVLLDSAMKFAVNI